MANGCVVYWTGLTRCSPSRRPESKPILRPLPRCSVSIRVGKVRYNSIVRCAVKGRYKISRHFGGLQMNQLQQYIAMHNCLNLHAIPWQLNMPNDVRGPRARSRLFILLTAALWIKTEQETESSPVKIPSHDAADVRHAPVMLLRGLGCWMPGYFHSR